MNANYWQNQIDLANSSGNISKTFLGIQIYTYAK